MDRGISPLWIWGGSAESGRAIHRAENLVADSCATVEKIGLIGPNSSHDTAILEKNLGFQIASALAGASAARTADARPDRSYFASAGTNPHFDIETTREVKSSP